MKEVATSMICPSVAPLFRHPVRTGKTLFHFLFDKSNSLDFRVDMKGTEHLNFHAQDPNLGPALVSIKDVTTEDGGQLTLIILRLCIGTFQQVKLY